MKKTFISLLTVLSFFSVIPIQAGNSSAAVSGTTYKRITDTNVLSEYDPGSWWAWDNYYIYAEAKGTSSTRTEVKIVHKNHNSGSAFENTSTFGYGTRRATGNGGVTQAHKGSYSFAKSGSNSTRIDINSN